MAATKLTAGTVNLVVSAVGTLLAPLLAPLVAAQQASAQRIADVLTGQEAQARQLAAMQARLEAMSAPTAPPAPPPTTTPDPAPPPPPAGTRLYEATLNQGADAAWTFSTAGRARVQRGLAQRYEVAVPKAVVGVGSLRLVLDVYPTGWADLALRNDGAMILDGGPATLSLVVACDGKELLRVERDTIHHYAARIYPIGQPIYPEVSVQALLEAGLIHPYRQGEISASVLDRMARAVASPEWRLPGNGREITSYMPMSGGRWDIGPATTGQAAYLISGDPTAWDYIIGQAEAAACIPWGLWDVAQRRWLSALDYPALWTDGRGGTGTPGNRKSGGLSQQLPSPGVTGWTLDAAHMPSLSYVPFLLTERESFRDNALAQGAWSILNTWPARRGERGLIVVDDQQVRQAAWALRQVDEARVVALPGTPEAALFDAASDANWSWLAAMIPHWMREQGEAHGFIPGGYGGGALPVWQQAYFTTTSAAEALLGNQHAMDFLRFQANFFIGAAEHLGNDACAYLLVGFDQSGKPLGTWDAIRAATVAAGLSNGTGWTKSEGDYGQLTTMALRLIHRILGIEKAKVLADDLVGRGAPFTDTKAYLKDLQFRIG